MMTNFLSFSLDVKQSEIISSTVHQWKNYLDSTERRTIKVWWKSRGELGPFVKGPGNK